MFSAFFVRRPIVAIVISIVTVIVGLVALMGLPIEQYPRLSPPMVRVTGVYPGAGAEAVEQSVATPIEQQINGVDNMIYMMSRNTSDGTASIDVTFDVGTDLNNANVLTQNRVARANSRLPQDVLQQGVIVQKINPSLLMMVSVASPGGTYDAEFLNNYAMINVRDQLLRVPGVSQVELLGGSEYAMRIWIKPDRLAALGLTSTDVWAAVRDQNVQAPAGKIGAAPSAPGQENTYTVSAPGRLTTPEEFGDIIIKETADGRIVRVRDVARVELGSENYKSFGRLNGKPSAMLAIYLLPGANQLESSKGIYAMLESMKTIFPKDVIAEVGYDTTPAVEASIEEIVQTLFEAVLLVIIVVFIFLQNGRATLIPLLTVPVSLIGTFAIFPLVGFTINTVSLFGLVLAIGIVVDDAIVVVEAVMHHIEHGMSPRGHERSVGSGDRHCTHLGGCVRSSGIPWWNHGNDLPAVCYDNCILCCAFGLQRTNVESGTCCYAPQANKYRGEGSAQSLLSLVQSCVWTCDNRICRHRSLVCPQVCLVGCWCRSICCAVAYHCRTDPVGIRAERRSRHLPCQRDVA